MNGVFASSKVAQESNLPDLVSADMPAVLVVYPKPSRESSGTFEPLTPFPSCFASNRDFRRYA